MYLIEARRLRQGDQPAGIARFIVISGSRHAALTKLRAHYDTSGIDSLTTTPLSGVVPISGALVHDMRRVEPEPEAPQAKDGNDDDEPWRRSA